MDNEFQSSYVIIRDKRTIFNDLKKSGDQASTIYLATDPDREGEAISWHLQTFFFGGNLPGGYDPPTLSQRVTVCACSDLTMPDNFAWARESSCQ